MNGPFHELAFNTMFLKDIPHLAECGVLRMECDKPHVAIPVISKAEYGDVAGAGKINFNTLVLVMVQNS